MSTNEPVQTPVNEKIKKTSTGLHINCPHDIQSALSTTFEMNYNFLVTQITHPSNAYDLRKNTSPMGFTRTDRVLQSGQWSRLIVGELNSDLNVDSEIEHVAHKSKLRLFQELDLAMQLSIPVVKLTLHQRNNPRLAQIINEKLIVTGHNCYTSMWITLPMVHPSQFSPIADVKEDSWDWWNEFRIYCNYDRHIGLALELPESHHLPDYTVIDRWIGEPVKALIIPTSLFLPNNHENQVLSKAHQEIIRRFLTIDVQYIIKSDGIGDLSKYPKYISYLGRKLYCDDPTTRFAQGVEDFVQNPLQPLSEHLETHIYEVFEKDPVKYCVYQQAIERALGAIPAGPEIPVVMVVGAGRGPLVQAVLNAAYIQKRQTKIYAIEKNPFAINTLQDRNEHEWNGQIVLINQDMRHYRPEEKADILVSELLGSFGDNELSPECLDGAQQFLKDTTGISIPSSYSSYLAPLQSIKIFNEIRVNRPNDKQLITCFETPYVIKLVNYYQIASPQRLFTFSHPNRNSIINNERYKRLRFYSHQNCVLTGFVGYFDTVLYKDIMLSIHPDTYTKDMVSWFPIVFPIQMPLSISADTVIEVSFWRLEDMEKVWYEWCLEAPIRTAISNPGGRSFFIKKR